MATVVITPEMQRANAEALLGNDPGKFRDPGQRWTAKRYAEIQRLLKQAEADKPVTILNLNPFHSRSMAVSFSLRRLPLVQQANLTPST
jgi:hypothetical protein